LFVGAFNALSPNADSVLWFLDDILPRVRRLLGAEVPFTIAGHDPPAELTRRRVNGVYILGSVADLEPLYDAARVFVAPTRYAAGIPFKVGHAAAHGLPVVVTTLLARQLDWAQEEQLLAADTADAFADACVSLYKDRERWHRLRNGAIARIADEYSASRFSGALAAALSDTPPGPDPSQPERMSS